MMPGLSSALGMRPRRTAGSGNVTLTSGTSWTVPANFDPTKNTVECYGGGGPGGQGWSDPSNFIYGGGGGGGGAYAKGTNLNLTPGTVITISIGAGDGSDTAFGSSVLAEGGGFGQGSPTGAGGQGGPSSTSIGSPKISGGPGSAGTGGNPGGGGERAGNQPDEPVIGQLIMAVGTGGFAAGPGGVGTGLAASGYGKGGDGGAGTQETGGGGRAAGVEPRGGNPGMTGNGGAIQITWG